ncbi:Os02g0805300 [Oryza sativa Japonica Group]|uniref:Os02g0805300 protein n=2 Tax=Oryza sativa subsp. japonica TaxID=39947 RepID=Q0DWN5_ORYSJ|nr:hypothetical protein EE612_014325 [Oryza sativa]BAD19424.1 unknown protein [Oryza sativa Japonica Group]BAF10353.1 Os02g0805300 [Oryza sativa Japonica Group]BAS81459.1 Os02g0805300 [Oryza sativa Japonica Group]|eukprot:NP_001048439.1 Os02g0805300 [Oryza sativa Japonica Group]
MGSMYRHLRDRSSRRRRFSPAWRQELARQESPGVAGGRRQGRWCRSWHGRRIGRDDQEIGLLPANRGGRRNPPGGDPGAERRRRRVPIHGHGRAGEVPLQLACLTDETQVRGLPFKEAGGAENGRGALLQAGRRRCHAEYFKHAKKNSYFLKNMYIYKGLV